MLLQVRRWLPERAMVVVADNSFAASTGYFGIWGNGGKIDAIDIALILGTGPVLISAAMVVGTSGARTAVVEPIPNRRERALKYGAEAVIDPTDSLVEQIEALTDGRMGTVVVECSG